jgi:hypothetical protein
MTSNAILYFDQVLILMTCVYVCHDVLLSRDFPGYVEQEVWVSSEWLRQSQRITGPHSAPAEPHVYLRNSGRSAGHILARGYVFLWEQQPVNFAPFCDGF